MIHSKQADSKCDRKAINNIEGEKCLHRYIIPILRLQSSIKSCITNTPTPTPTWCFKYSEHNNRYVTNTELIIRSVTLFTFALRSRKFASGVRGGRGHVRAARAPDGNAVDAPSSPGPSTPRPFIPSQRTYGRLFGGA